MKKFGRFLFLIVAFFCLFVPQVTNSYDFESKGKEEQAKGTQREIYDLYNVYKEVVKSNNSNNSNNSQFGIMNYNGACSTVTIDGSETVPLEEYIAGCVNAEIGCSNNYIEMSKAQAIAARSFLMARKGDSANCSVVSSQSFQVYKKIDKNSEYGQLCMSIANATAGMVVSRNGKAANTSYQSYPAGQFQTEDSSGWHVQFQRYADDESTKWTWNGPSKSTVLSISSGYEMDYNNPHNWGMSQTIGRYLAIAEGYTFEQIIQLFYGDPIVTLSDGNYTGDISYVDSEFGKVVYWNQGDYKNYYYSSDASKCTITQGGCATIASHGCGPTSAAIVASSMLQRSVTPIEMTEKVCQAGGCTSSGSYNDTLGKVLKNNYGLNVKMSNSDQEVINALGSKNALVIVLMGKGTFTTGGHYIVLTGVNSNGQVSVADPGSRARTETKWFSFNTIVEQRKTYANYTIVTR